MTFATGEQYDLALAGALGPVRATIVELAAGIRGLTVDGVALTEPYGPDTIAPMACGIALVPWPNRIRSARWSDEGTERALDVTEPSTGNASHGLLRNTGYRLVERTGSSVLQAATVFPQHGYPYRLDTTVEHALVDDGLRVTHRIRNVGDGHAPIAVGAHPFLRVGEVPSSELTLTVHAERFLITDAQQIPVETAPVARMQQDLAAGPLVGSLDLDVGLTGLADGDERARLTAADGRATVLWADPVFSYLQVFTPRAFPAPEGQRQAVALEPMTAPADAFNSGHGLIRLAPGEEWTASWGIRYQPAG